MASQRHGATNLSRQIAGQRRALHRLPRCRQRNARTRQLRHRRDAGGGNGTLAGSPRTLAGCRDAREGSATRLGADLQAFSGQYLSVEKDLGIDRDKVNVNGGAIGLGHPLGATGTRLIYSVLVELGRRGKKYGIASACIGGGQGMAVLVERA